MNDDTANDDDRPLWARISIDEHVDNDVWRPGQSSRVVRPAARTATIEVVEADGTRWVLKAKLGPDATLTRYDAPETP